MKISHSPLLNKEKSKHEAVPSKDSRAEYMPLKNSFKKMNTYNSAPSNDNQDFEEKNQSSKWQHDSTENPQIFKRNKSKTAENFLSKMQQPNPESEFPPIDKSIGMFGKISKNRFTEKLGRSIASPYNIQYANKILKSYYDIELKKKANDTPFNEISQLGFTVNPKNRLPQYVIKKLKNHAKITNEGEKSKMMKNNFIQEAPDHQKKLEKTSIYLSSVKIYKEADQRPYSTGDVFKKKSYQRKKTLSKTGFQHYPQTLEIKQDSSFELKPIPIFSTIFSNNFLFKKEKDNLPDNNTQNIDFRIQLN